MRRRRSICRIVTRASVFLLLGAIINAAVAWGCAIWITAGSPQFRRIDKEAPFALFVRHQPFTEQYTPTLWVYSVENPGEEDLLEVRRAGLRIFHVSSERHAGRQASMLAVSSGWPLLAVRGELWRARGERSSDERLVYALDCKSMRITPPKDTLTFLEGSRLIPLEPLSPGFAINTLFYAAILWGLFAAPFALRRRRRIKRGLCPKCAYDLRGCASQNCPECGQPVAKHKAQTQKAEMT